MNKGFDAIRFLKSIRTDFTIHHHHCSPGWVNVHCPFCPASAKRNYHLGIEPSSGRVHCWRCGGHPLWELLKILSKGKSVKTILEEFGGKGIGPTDVSPTHQAPSVLTLPPGTGHLLCAHIEYLKSRGFNPQVIEKEWGIMGTSHLGSYCHRIIIPIWQGGVLSSYTSRDVTGRSSLRYKTCPKEEEVYPMKKSLYGLDKVMGDSVIVVEGPVDVWRLGAGAVATFGIGWTESQMLVLTKFKQVSILFDNEPQAQKQAHKLAEELSWLVDEVVVLSGIEGKDPGEMTEQEVKALRTMAL